MLARPRHHEPWGPLRVADRVSFSLGSVSFCKALHECRWGRCRGTVVWDLGGSVGSPQRKLHVVQHRASGPGSMHTPRGQTLGLTTSSSPPGGRSRGSPGGVPGSLPLLHGALARPTARGGCWATRPDTHYYKWWGGWQSIAVAMQCATKWKDTDVIAEAVLPTFIYGHQPHCNGRRIGLLSIWGAAMYPDVPKALHRMNGCVERRRKKARW